jgi:hypothetical protein
MTAGRIDATDALAGGGMAASNVIPFPAHRRQNRAHQILAAADALCVVRQRN